MTSKAGFATLLDEHAGLLSRIASSYEADPALRDDLLQDIAMALWRALPDWRGEASLKTFVARIAHNRCVTHVASRVRRPATAELDENIAEADAHGPDEHAHRDQQRLRLQAAVRGLPLGLRQAVSLALEGFSHQEIADALGIAANSVGVRLHRARAALTSALGDGR